MATTVGPYQLGDSLGEAPFGELVAATHSARSEPLAVLLLDARLAKDHRFRGLLRLEIARAGSVRHAAIARAIEVGEHGGAPYVVVQRPADTRTLASALADGEPPSRAEAVALLRHLAEALDAAHGRRLVHGALDPTSVLVGPGGSTALVGLALIGAVEEAGLNAIVVERTDAAYTAPEQRTGRRTVASADAYALGALAATLLLVQPPPAGPADAIGTVLARQHAADPADRFPSCTAFVTALSEALALATSSTTAVATSPRSSPIGSAPAPVDDSETSPAPAPLPASLATSAPVPAPALSPPTDTQTASAPPLPWNVPAEPVAQASAVDADTLSLAPPPGPPPSEVPDAASPTPERPPDPPSPGALDGWISSVIDPPQLAQPFTTGLERPAAPPWHPDRPTNRMQVDASEIARAPAPVAGEVSVTNLTLTPAMQAVLKAPEQRDLIGDGIILAASRFPAFEDLLDRYVTDGKLRGVPLGVAAAGALILLMLFAGQLWPATVLIMIAAIIYGVPKLGAVLTASERANVRPVRVTGGARLSPTSPTTGARVPQLTLRTSVSLSVRDAEYGTLGSFGLPITVERPVFGVGGVREEVVGYDLPDAIVTYLEPVHTLLDVRSGDGRVLYRRPPYQGEPDDLVDTTDPRVTSASSETASSDAASTDTSGAVPWSQPAYVQPRGPVSVLPLPPAAQASLRKAAESAAPKAIAIVVGPLLLFVVGSQLIGGFAFFVLFAMLGLFASGIGGIFTQALRLWNSRHCTSMVRVEGSVFVSRFRANKSHAHVVRLADGMSIKVDADTYGKLTSAGERRVEDAGPVRTRAGPRHARRVPHEPARDPRRYRHVYADRSAAPGGPRSGRRDALPGAGLARWRPRAVRADRLTPAPLLQVLARVVMHARRLDG